MIARQKEIDRQRRRCSARRRCRSGSRAAMPTTVDVTVMVRLSCMPCAMSPQRLVKFGVQEAGEEARAARQRPPTTRAQFTSMVPSASATIEQRAAIDDQRSQPLLISGGRRQRREATYVAASSRRSGHRSRAAAVLNRTAWRRLVFLVVVLRRPADRRRPVLLAVDVWSAPRRQPVGRAVIDDRAARRPTMRCSEHLRQRHVVDVDDRGESCAPRRSRRSAA